MLLMRNRGRGLEMWLLPYPADPNTPPFRVLEGVLPARSRDPYFSWLPDSRRGVLAISSGSKPSRLYIADTVLNTLRPLSSGTTAQMYPAVSPDGARVAFTERRGDFNIIQVDVSTGGVTPFISTRRNEDMPAWALKSNVLSYVTDRTGAPEIWLHRPGRPDTPIVTERDFSTGATSSFMCPSLSPDGTRLIFCRVEADGKAVYLWMSSVSGGSPVRLTDSVDISEHSGGWSPDGKWYVYLGAEGGTVSVRRVLTAGRATSEVLVPPVDWENNGFALPIWSPAGDWILYNNNGWRLLALDGRTERDLGLHATVCAFSHDSSDLYYVRQSVRGGVLATAPVFGGAERIIANLAEDQLPSSAYRPALRMTFSPDGQFLTFSAEESETDLWLMELTPEVHGRRPVSKSTQARRSASPDNRGVQ